MTLELHSSAFRQGETIPIQFTGEGADQLPPLHWTMAPLGTKSFAIICDDPDAPYQTFTHWIAFNIPATSQQLPEGATSRSGLPSGTLQGMNNSDQLDYSGPLPPPGSPHRYFFKLYALDSFLDLGEGATKQDVLEAMKGHILGDAEIMGIYQR
jgi:Raf kinase inhibitor-like YbhB/YbcL family protein